MNAVTTFKTPSGDEMVIIPAADFARLVEAAEMAEDIAAFDEFKRRLAAGKEELVPAEFANRLIDGENPIRVWREYRGLSLKDLAAKAGIARPYLSQMEGGKRDGTVNTMRKIAEALGVAIDDLV